MKESIRGIKDSDREEVLSIWRDGKSFLKSMGVPQWQNGPYPSLEEFSSDLKNEIGFVLLLDDEIVAYFAFTDSPELSYSSLEGSWINERGGYGTIHRAAVRCDMRGRGIMARILSFGEKRAREMGLLSVRIDTHEKNLPMQASLRKAGYNYVGEITLARGPEKGDKRLAWEKAL